MSSTDKYQVGAAPIDQVIADLQRRVLALETSPRLQSSSIDVGALQVRDASGDVRVIIGLLPDGNYGFMVKENGQNTLHEVPFIYSDFIGTGETCSSTTYADLATVGPQVNVAVGSSGRILVIATAQIQWITSDFAAPVGDGRFDVAFSGANTRSPNEAVDPVVGILRLVSGNTGGTPNSSIAARASLTAQATFANLTPGLTTITMKYRIETDDNASPVQIFRRGLTVIRL